MPRGIKWTCTKPPKFTAQHFAYIAELIRKMDTNEPIRPSWAMYFARHLKHTNNKFHLASFLNACDPTDFAEIMRKKHLAAEKKANPKRKQPK